MLFASRPARLVFVLTGSGVSLVFPGVGGYELLDVMPFSKGDQ